jgi:large subunit ribosomal protein L24
MAKKFKIRKGDKVVAIAGEDKGKAGDVLRVLRREDRVLVQGLNMIKRHQRPTQASPGGIVEKEASIHISNVAHIDPKTDQPTRVGYRTVEADRKVRYAKRSGEVIDS